MLDGQNSFYKSFTLATCLLTKRHVTCVGTWIANRKILPKDFKKVDKSKILLREFYWNSKNDLILGSYVDSSSRKKKNNVLIVATCRPFLGTTTDDGKNKAMLYKLYNFTNGQMDIVNQQMGFYTSKVKGRKWLMVPFPYILDMARVNASTLFLLNHKKDPLKQYSFVFGMSVSPFIQQRKQSRLSLCVKTKIALALSMMGIQIPNSVNTNSTAASFLSLSGQKKTFKLFIEKIEPYETQKSIVSQKSLCQFCGNHSCQKHLVHICDSCKENRF